MLYGIWTKNFFVCNVEESLIMRKLIPFLTVISLLMTIHIHVHALSALTAFGGEDVNSRLILDAESSFKDNCTWLAGAVYAKGTDLYRLTGRGSSLLASDFSERYPGVCVLDGCLYYTGVDGIMCISEGGAEPAEVSKRTGWIFTDGDELYCGTESSIFRITGNENEDPVLRVKPLVNEGAFAVMNTMSRFAATEGKIYYVLTMAQDYELWTVGTDGSNNSRIASICPPDREITALIYAPTEECVYIQFTDTDGLSWKAVNVGAA